MLKIKPQYFFKSFKYSLANINPKRSNFHSLLYYKQQNNHPSSSFNDNNKEQITQPSTVNKENTKENNENNKGTNNSKYLPVSFIMGLFFLGMSWFISRERNEVLQIMSSYIKVNKREDLQELLEQHSLNKNVQFYAKLQEEERYNFQLNFSYDLENFFKENNLQIEPLNNDVNIYQFIIEKEIKGSKHIRWDTVFSYSLVKKGLWLEFIEEQQLLTDSAFCKEDVEDLEFLTSYINKNERNKIYLDLLTSLMTYEHAETTDRFCIKKYTELQSQNILAPYLLKCNSKYDKKYTTTGATIIKLIDKLIDENNLSIKSENYFTRILNKKLSIIENVRYRIIEKRVHKDDVVCCYGNLERKDSVEKKEATMNDSFLMYSKKQRLLEELKNYKLDIPYNEYMVDQKDKLVFKPMVLQLNQNTANFENHLKHEEKTLTNIYFVAGVASIIYGVFCLI
ncbi:hypothetical protein ABK040_009315 [Willaertia magna]